MLMMLALSGLQTHAQQGAIALSALTPSRGQLMLMMLALSGARGQLMLMMLALLALTPSKGPTDAHDARLVGPSRPARGQALSGPHAQQGPARGQLMLMMLALSGAHAQQWAN